MTASPAFTEKAPHETGFAAFYDSRIRPEFQSLKTEEKKHRRGGLRWAAIVLGVGVLPVAGAIWLGLGPMGGAWWPGIMAALVVLFVAVMGLAASSQMLDDRARKTILPLLMDFRSRNEGEKLRFIENPRKDFVDAETFGSLRLFPDALFPNSFETRRGIEGTSQGIPYKAAHVLMENVSRTHSDTDRRKTLYSGGLLELNLQELTGRDLPLTVFCANRDGLGPFATLADLVKSRDEIVGRKVHSVALAGPELENAYDVYSEDPTGLPVEVATAFAQTLADVAKSIFGEARYVAAAFVNGKVLIALPATDLPHRLERGFLDLRAFNLGEETFLEELHAALEDLSFPARVIAGLSELR